MKRFLRAAAIGAAAILGSRPCTAQAFLSPQVVDTFAARVSGPPPDRDVADAGQPPLSPQAIDTFAARVIGSRLGRDVASAALLVVQGDRVMYLRAFGFARPARRMPARADSTFYQVGSLSKLFVATAALQQVEMGRLRLDEDVRRYLGDVRIGGCAAPVTLGELLTHTSGIDDRKLGRTRAADGRPLESLGAFFRRHPPRCGPRPGEELNYSGNAMSLAAHVVERVSGERFDAYARRHIFAPLGMESATFTQPLPPALKARRASMADLPPLVKYPEGGLAMTPADMAPFLIAQLNGGAYRGRSILRPGTLALMQAHHFPRDASMPGIAYGWFEATLNGHRALVHTGDYQHQLLVAMVPDARIAWFLAVAPRGGELREPLISTFAADFARRFVPPGPAAASPPILPVAADEAARFTGTWRDDAVPHHSLERFFVGLLFGEGDARVTYDAAKRRLLFQPPGAEPLPLERLGPDRFRVADPRLGAQLQFATAADGRRTFYASAGALGAYTFSRVPAWQGQVPQLLFFLAAMLVFGAWTAFVALRWLWRLVRRRRGDGRWSPRECRLAAAATVASAAGAGGFAGFSLLGMTIPSVAMMVGIPAAFYVLPIGSTIACIAALPLAAAAVMAWRTRAFALPVRIFHSLVAVVALAFIPFCWSWNLLGLLL